MKMRKLFVSLRNAFSILLSVLAIVIFGGSLTGCNSQMGGTPPPVGNTQVVVLLTSTANDQLSGFGISLGSIALTDNTGKLTTIFTGADPQFGTGVEWMHLNGASEPLVTVSVARGVYTAATVKVDGCAFTSIDFFNQTINTSTYAQGLCGQGTGTATVNLPSPITVTGSVMGLSLDLQAPQSFTLIGEGTNATYTISPTFNLSAVSIAPQPTDETNGKVIGVAGQVMSINANGNSFTARTPDGALLTVSSNTNTAYQGVAAFTSLSANLLVNFDAAVQSDGSLLATRVEVDDPTAPGAAIGPYVFPGSPAGTFATLNLETNGCADTGNPVFCGEVYWYSSNTVFNISQEFSNLASLPFSPTFSSNNFLLGQHLSVFTPGTFTHNSQNVGTITLVPQTLNGTVTAISSDAGFNVYTVALATYDLIPALQLYSANSALPHITDPTTVVIYTDTNSNLLISGAVNVGSLLRFKGLVFDDNGALRMDCSEIYDGVTE
jgi:hypothetical protein